jgi:MATE family, multidrug efflux pump
VAFAAQGVGHVLWPFVGSVTRILVAAGLGWIAVGCFGAGMAALASMVTASLLAYAAICAFAMLSNRIWTRDK